MKRFVRDEAGAWSSASRGRKAIGLVVGLALSGLVVVPIIVIVVGLIAHQP